MKGLAGITFSFYIVFFRNEKWNQCEDVSLEDYRSGFILVDSIYLPYAFECLFICCKTLCNSSAKVLQKFLTLKKCGIVLKLCILCNILSSLPCWRIMETIAFTYWLRKFHSAEFTWESLCLNSWQLHQKQVWKKIQLHLQQSDLSCRLTRAHEEPTEPENKLSQYNKNKSIKHHLIKCQMTHYVLCRCIRSPRYNYSMFWGSGVSLLRNTLSGWLNFVTLRKHFLKAGLPGVLQWWATGKEFKI